ncbi:hypothetical protein KCP76_00980 [Salmonella enterica subsp. enterica serovar Weltevreden]|nr:hypothetical protein KCP76_00980 [Salmonella enterica subsp. enterica serovar Weltevreden]
MQAIVDINGHGISTSGSYRIMSWMASVSRIVIDPQTGRPIEHNLARLRSSRQRRWKRTAGTPA